MSDTQTVQSPATRAPVEDERPAVLVLDDEESLRNLLSELLSPNYHVACAETCSEALKMVSESCFNVAIVDVNLPDISGKNFLRLCKKNFIETQIIIITGSPEIDDAVELVKQGAYDYLAKPFSSEKILRKVAAAVNDGREKANKKLPGSNYRMIRHLGSGASGIVLLVEKDGCRYAMKILRREDDPASRPQQIRRFAREARILSGIRHNGVIRIHDYDLNEEQELPYIVMEYVKGDPLTSFINSPALSLDRRLEIIGKVAETLYEVHKAGVLHRDIKPENILITDDGGVKISDFGISRVLGISSSTMTKDIVGSPAYMSPESFEAVKNMDHRSDIFSLGVLAYELLTRVRPFQGANIFQIIEAIKTRNPVQPSKLNPEIPSWIEDMLAKMLAKRPSDRFDDARQIVKCITHYSQGLSSSSMTITARLLRSMLFIKRDWD